MLSVLSVINATVRMERNGLDVPPAAGYDNDGQEKFYSFIAM